jgi:hypothetical protein
MVGQRASRRGRGMAGVGRRARCVRTSVWLGSHKRGALVATALAGVGCAPVSRVLARLVWRGDSRLETGAGAAARGMLCERPDPACKYAR